MRQHFRLRLIFALGVLFASQFAFASPPCNTLPDGVRKSLSSETGLKVLQLEDLEADDHEIWTKNHSPECPGIVRADLGIGSGASIAVAEISSAGKKQERLILFVPKGYGWERKSIVGARDITNPMVIWLSRSKTAKAWDGGPTHRLNHDGIVFEALEASATLYYFAGGALRSIQTSD